MKPTRLLILSGLISLITLASSDLFADNLVSNVDRNRIGLNETLNLVLEYDEQIDLRSIDLSSLQQDFEILNNSQSSQVSIINGRQDVSTNWNLVLLPRRAGQLIIPSFQVDGNFSQAIAIDVSEANNTGPRSRPINVEVELSEENIFAMQQILVTVRLIASNQVSNLSGDNFIIDGAEVELLDQKQFTQVQDGINWQIIEWVYALFPDQPGTLQVPVQTFSGLTGATPSFFGSSGGQRVLARSEPISIQVLAALSEQNWLPAQEVIIQSEWPRSQDASSLPEFRVGEPVTRTITIAAVGQRMETIPPLPQFTSEAFKVYADQPELLEQTSADNLIGIRRESAAIVPTNAGELVLPEIRIPWWDTDEEAWKEAVLPEEPIFIQEAETNAALAPPEIFIAEGAETSNGNIISTSNSVNPIWQWISAVMSLTTLILAFLLWQGRTKRPKVVATEKVNLAEQKCWKQLQQDIKNGDASVIRSSIENWCRAIWPNESSFLLTKLSDRLSSSAQNELRHLEKSIYGANSQESLDFSSLLAELSDLRRKGKTEDSNESSLPPLYPKGT